MQARDEIATPAPVLGVESIDPMKLWLLGLAIEPDGTLAGPGLRKFSFFEECECPVDCNRDHQND